MQRRITATWFLGALLCAGIAAWALWLPAQSDGTPLPPVLTDGANGPKSTLEPVPVAVPAIDPKLLAGGVHLWNAPPLPPPERFADNEAKAKPLNLQLVGIIDDADGVKRAALYDGDADRLFIVAAGDKVGVGAQTVQQVLAREVTLSDGTATRRLVLQDGGSS